MIILIDTPTFYVKTIIKFLLKYCYLGKTKVIPWLFSCTSRKSPSKSSSGIKAILSFCNNFHKTSDSIFVVYLNTITT
jgi:hypothetical protein